MTVRLLTITRSCAELFTPYWSFEIWRESAIMESIILIVPAFFYHGKYGNACSILFLAFDIDAHPFDTDRSGILPINLNWVGLRGLNSPGERKVSSLLDLEGDGRFSSGKPNIEDRVFTDVVHVRVIVIAADHQT